MNTRVKLFATAMFEFTLTENKIGTELYEKVTHDLTAQTISGPKSPNCIGIIG